ncbi:MAG: diacylglycerol kinase [Patescibacteria group bacterium]
MAKPKSKGGFGHIMDAFGYSLQGVTAMWKREESFRLEIIIYSPFILVALFLGETYVEKALLIGSVFFIFFAELTNSAIEAIVDRIGDDIHPLSRIAKDSGSAVVMSAMVIFWLLWVATFADRFLPRFF